MERGAQLPGLALSAADGPGQRERTLRGALLLGVRKALAAQVLAELGSWYMAVIFFPGGGWSLCSTVTGRRER